VEAQGKAEIILRVCPADVISPSCDVRSLLQLGDVGRRRRARYGPGQQGGNWLTAPLELTVDGNRIEKVFELAAVAPKGTAPKFSELPVSDTPAVGDSAALIVSLETLLDPPLGDRGGHLYCTVLELTFVAPTTA